MGDIGVLLARDHGEIERMAAALTGFAPRTPDWVEALDCVRLGFAAHAEAQEHAVQSVIAHRVGTRPLARMLDGIRADHRRQELLIERLFDDRRSGKSLVADALELRVAVMSHDEEERLLVVPALQVGLAFEDYQRLAPTYATERLRALGIMSNFVPRRPVAAVVG